jgi:hypothetical protein
MQSVSSHLLGYEKLLVTPRSWAIHVIHLIMTQLKKRLWHPATNANNRITLVAVHKAPGELPRLVAKPERQPVQ